MKTRFLFPHKWRIAGFILLLVAVIVMCINYHYSGGITAPTIVDNTDSPFGHDGIMAAIHNDILGVALVIGLLMVGFSKEKIEDEQISQLRLESLQWAIYVNYLIFVLCVLFIYGTTFLAVILYNTITPLLIFIIRFRWKLYQLNRQYKES